MLRKKIDRNLIKISYLMCLIKKVAELSAYCWPKSSELRRVMNKTCIKWNCNGREIGDVDVGVNALTTKDIHKHTHTHTHIYIYSHTHIHKDTHKGSELHPCDVRSKEISGGRVCVMQGHCWYWNRSCVCWNCQNGDQFLKLS